MPTPLPTWDGVEYTPSVGVPTFRTGDGTFSSTADPERRLQRKDGARGARLFLRGAWGRSGGIIPRGWARAYTNVAILLAGRQFSLAGEMVLKV
jgi:hypothetical protein